jgi:hypothetical protein
MLARLQPGGGYVYDHTTKPDRRPLARVARMCRDHPALPDLDPGDFMYMGRVVHPTRPPILLYKHTLTRRYLHLDTTGHAYLWRSQAAGGQYIPFSDLQSAIQRVRAYGPPSTEHPSHSGVQIAHPYGRPAAERPPLAL